MSGPRTTTAATCTHKMATWSEWFVSRFQWIPKIGNKTPNKTYLRVTASFKARDSRGVNEHTFEKDSIVQRLDEEEENGYVWVTYYQHRAQEPVAWDGWVPLKNLEGCVPGCYQVICAGDRAKRRTRSNLKKGTLLDIKKLPSGAGTDRPPSWSQGDIIIERLMPSADLWHYIDIQSRESGTIPASCLKFVFKGHPPTPPSSSSRMPASNTVDQSTSTVVSAQDPKDMTKVHVPPLSLQFKAVSASMPDLQSTVDSLPESPHIPAAVLPTKNIPNRLLDNDRTTLFEEPNTTKLTSCRHPTLTEMHTWPATSVSCAHPSRSCSPRVIDAESFLDAQQRHKRQSETATTDEIIPMKPLSRESA